MGYRIHYLRPRQIEAGDDDKAMDEEILVLKLIYQLLFFIVLSFRHIIYYVQNRRHSWFQEVQETKYWGLKRMGSEEGALRLGSVERTF